MTVEQDSRAEHPPSVPPASPQPSRRAFLARARYVAPLVLTLAATPRHASASSPAGHPSCHPSGTPCLSDDECCSNRCDSGGTNLCLPPL